MCRKCFDEKNNHLETPMKQMVTDPVLRELAAAHHTAWSFLEDRVPSVIVRMTATDEERTSFHYVFASDKIEQAAVRVAERMTDNQVTMFVSALRAQRGGKVAGDLMKQQLLDRANMCRKSANPLLLRGLFKSTRQEKNYKCFVFDIRNVLSFASSLAEMQPFLQFPCLWFSPSNTKSQAVDFLYTAQDGSVVMLQSKSVGDPEEGVTGKGMTRNMPNVRVDVLAKVLKQLPEQQLYPFVWVMSDMSPPWPNFKDTIVEDGRKKSIMLHNDDRELLKKVVEASVEFPNNRKARRAEGLKEVHMRAGEFLEELGKQLTDETRYHDRAPSF